MSGISGDSAEAGDGAELRYRMLFDHSSDGILITDVETRTIRQANAAAALMFDYDEGELAGMSASALHPEESQARTLNEVVSVAAGDMSIAHDVPCLKKDRTVFFADITATPIIMGGRSKIATFVRDVTERRSAQHAIAASEMRYRRLFETAQDGILILEATEGSIVDVNPYLYELMGYERADFIGHPLWDIGPFKNVAAAKESFAELQTKGYVRYEHLPLQARDGRPIDVEFVSNLYEVDGKTVIQCNIRDITERRRGEAALEVLQRAIEAVSQGIVITDPRLPDNPITYVSPGFVRLSGYTSAEALGRNCRFMSGSDTEATSLITVRQALHDERGCTVELINYRKEGTTFWNQLTISPVRDADGLLTNFVGVQTDVTERKRIEAQFLQAQKMEAVGRLAGGVAHDFNNILSVILSYAELILGDLKSEDPLRADVEEMRRAALRAKELTKQLLAFSRQQVLEGKVLNLDESIAGVVPMLRRLLGADIALTILGDPALLSVKADPGQVEQVLLNLAVNARDAMPDGGELTLETENVTLDADYAHDHPDVQAGPYVMLAVSDTGVGMDETTQAQIFEPFFTTKAKGKGTGLGLATVFGIVKQSGGHIWVYSEPGHGTTFKLYFPQVPGVAQVSRLPIEAPERALRKETILLVEDDDQVRAVAQSILRRAGYVVLTAPNGGEAFLICEKHGAKIDLLLTDVVLPRMSGRQLAERLAPLRPEMKVLFMSGYTDDAVLQHGVLDSGVAYLQKPITPSSLTKKVLEVLAAPR